MSSVTPWGASGDRRMTSRETPARPQGTRDRSPTRDPSGPCAVTCRTSSSARSPDRPRAIEKPRSVSPRRQASARSESSDELVGPQLALAADPHLDPGAGGARDGVPHR